MVYRMGEGHNDIWGSGPDDVYVVGDAGRIHHFDGELWRRQENGTTANLWSINGASASAAAILGEGRTLLRKRNGGWESDPWPHYFRRGDMVRVAGDGTLFLSDGFDNSYQRSDTPDTSTRLPARKSGVVAISNWHNGRMYVAAGSGVLLRIEN